MASGGSRLRVGSAVGTGADMSIVVGFRPKYVRLLNTDGDCQAEWARDMADDSMQKVVDSGAGATDISLVTSDGITPAGDGFALGADTDLNVDGQTVRWMAWD